MKKKKSLRISKPRFFVEFVGWNGDFQRYEVRLIGGDKRKSIIEITATQSTRVGVVTDIRDWCRSNFNELKNGEIVRIDLDEVREI